ncbi:MAG: RNA methyltransferase [Emergencia sp.]|nr:RNA methyltransferase [Emergencia sp.]
MIKEIRSRDNRIYKECRKLSQKKYRDQQGLYLIEGYNLIGEAPASEMMYAVLREGADCGGLSGENIYIMEAELFDKIAQTETSQGIIAVMKRRIYDRQEVKRLCGPGKNLAVLDRLQDPGNIGTIIRTAEGAGYAAVVCLRGTGDVYAPKTIRAAAGSVFRIPIIKVEDNRELCGLVRDLGKRLAVTCLDTDNYYFDTDLSSDTALVIGNEGRGVSRELIETADVRVKIPMEGKLESLNASVAAGILMYEAQRKR